MKLHLFFILFCFTSYRCGQSVENNTIDGTQSKVKQKNVKDINNTKEIFNADDVILYTNHNVELPVNVIEVKLKNNSGTPVITGVDYAVEHYQDGDWKEIPLHYAFNSIGIVVPNGNVRQFKIDLQPERYKYVPGLYRVRKPVLLENKQQYVYAQFEINAKPGVYMEIGKQVIPISVETLEVTVINNTDKDVELGNIYYIEKSEADKWNRIALDRDTLGNIIAYDLVGYSLKPNAFIKKTYSLLKCAYNYRAGKYRIVIPYTQSGVDGEMASEFTVAER